MKNPCLRLVISTTKYIQNFHTCREFKIVKIHANTVVPSLTANSPITHVLPSIGSITMAAIISDLYVVVAKVNNYLAVKTAQL